MSNKLRKYFPMIRTKEKIMEEINNVPKLRAMFEEWSESRKREFLDFCSGAKGVKILYDSFFKEILNPDATPERIEDLLSAILGKKVHIFQVLPGDSSRIADESSLLIMDILVELEDGSIANVEAYIHRFSQKSDSGIEMNLLQEFFFIPLDIFRSILHNGGIKIDNKEKAWLTFLSEDSPEVIIRLIESYPEFKELYHDVYMLCRNVERVMGIFSEELRILDRNTVQLMIDEMQEEIDRLKAESVFSRKKLDDKDEEIARLRKLLGMSGDKQASM